MSDRIIRRPELRQLTGLSDSTIDRLERSGEFPARKRLGASAVGWLVSEVERWISERPASPPRSRSRNIEK